MPIGTRIDPLQIWLNANGWHVINEQRLALTNLRVRVDDRRSSLLADLERTTAELRRLDLFDQAISEAEQRVTVQRATGR